MTSVRHIPRTLDVALGTLFAPCVDDLNRVYLGCSNNVDATVAARHTVDTTVGDIAIVVDGTASDCTAASVGSTVVLVRLEPRSTALDS